MASQEGAGFLKGAKMLVFTQCALQQRGVEVD